MRCAGRILLPGLATAFAALALAAQGEAPKERQRLGEEALRALLDGKPEGTIKAAEQLLALDRKEFSKDHLRIADGLVPLASLYAQASHLDKAREAAREALALRVRRLGLFHWKTADARRMKSYVELLAGKTPAERARCFEAERLLEQAYQLRSKRRPREALPLLRKALAHQEQVLGKGHPDAARSLHQLGVVEGLELRFGGDQAAARQALEQAVAIRDKQLGRHPRTADSHIALGVLLRRQGRTDASLPHLVRGTRIRLQTLGDAQPDTLQAMESLVPLLWQAKKYDEARPFLKALAGVYRQSKKEPRRTATRLLDLADKLESVKEFIEAAACCQRVAALRAAEPGVGQKQLFELHLRATRDLLEAARDGRAGAALKGNLLLSQAGFLLRLERPAEARQVLEQVLPLTDKLSAVDRLRLARQLAEMGSWLALQRDYAAARRYLESAVAFHEKGQPTPHADTANALLALGGILAYQGDSAGAAARLRRALDIRTKVHGAGHAETTEVALALAALLQQLGQLADARETLQGSLAAHEKRRKPDPGRTAELCTHLGQVLQLQRDHEAARKHYERAVALYRTLPGKGAPESCWALMGLGQVLAASDAPRAGSLYREALELERAARGLAPHLSAMIRLTGLVGLAGCHENQGDFLAALDCLKPVPALRDQILSNSATLRTSAMAARRLVIDALVRHGLLRQKVGEDKEARRWLDQAADQGERQLGATDPTARSLGAPSLSLAGMGTGAVVHEVAAFSPPAAIPRPAAAMPSFGGLSNQAAPSCTLDDVCRRLEALERQRGTPPGILPAPRPLPRGEPTP